MSNIVFGNYTPAEEEDNGIQEVVIGVFDGTLNNERNSYLRKEYQKKKRSSLMIKKLRMLILLFRLMPIAMRTTFPMWRECTISMITTARTLSM